MRLTDVYNLSEKTYTPKGNGVQGKILSVGPAAQKNGWWNQAVMLKGIDNTQCLIDHSSQYPDTMLNQSHVGKDSTWRLKWWFNKNQQKKIMTGYPEVKIEGEGDIFNQENPAVPYDAPQTTRNAPQQANSTPDWDAIAEGKVRHGVVCAFIQAGVVELDYDIVERITKYIMTGQVPAPEPGSQEVCPSCRLLRADCSCPTEPYVR